MENNKSMDLVIKRCDEDRKTVDALVTNDTLDADGEIILNSAWKNFKRYKKNPVLMSSHAIYDLTKVIGECEKIEKTDKGINCTFKYYVGEGNQEADWAFVLAKKGMAAFSVGFLVHDLEWDQETMKELVEKNGIKIPKNRRLNAIITDAELYEISQVAVPSNMDALMKSKSISKKQKDAIAKSFDELQQEVQDIYNKIKMDEATDMKEEKTIVVDEKVETKEKTDELPEDAGKEKVEEKSVETKTEEVVEEKEETKTVVMLEVNLEDIVDMAVKKAIAALPTDSKSIDYETEIANLKSEIEALKEKSIEVKEEVKEVKDKENKEDMYKGIFDALDSYGIDENKDEEEKN